MRRPSQGTHATFHVGSNVAGRNAPSGSAIRSEPPPLKGSFAVVHSVVHWVRLLLETPVFSGEVDAFQERAPPFVAIEAERGNAPVRARIVNRNSVGRRADGLKLGLFY